MKNAYDFFKENRPIFLGCDTCGEVSAGGSESTENEVENETKSSLEGLKREVGNREPLAERDMQMPDDYKDKGPVFTNEDLENLATSKEMMRPAEVERMERGQEAIFRDYISPATLLFLRSNPNNQPVFDRYLMAAMKYPFDLKYEKTANGILITKRPKSEIPDSELPDDMSITVSEQGQVRIVKNIDIPSMSKADYDRVVAEEDYPKFMSEVLRVVKMLAKIRPAKGFPPSVIKPIFKLLYKSPSPRLKMIYEINNIILPQRLVQCIGARNKSIQLDNTSDGLYQTFAEAVSNNAKTYDEFVNDMLTDDLERNKWQLSTKIDSRYPGMYSFYMAQGGPPFVISHEGYFQKTKAVKTKYKEKDAKGQEVEKEKTEYTPVVNPAYDDRLKQLYYEQNPDAKTLGDIQK